MYNLITFETPFNSLSYSLSLRGTKNKATDTLVIASLNTKGVQAWQSPILGRIVIHPIKEKIARSEATKRSRSPTQRVGECVGEANLIWDCHGLPTGALAMTKQPSFFSESNISLRLFRKCINPENLRLFLILYPPHCHWDEVTEKSGTTPPFVFTKVESSRISFGYPKKRLALPTKFANQRFAKRDCHGFPKGSLAMTVGLIVIARSEATKQTTLLSLRAWTL
jgi:hypothetical protein